LRAFFFEVFFFGVFLGAFLADLFATFFELFFAAALPDFFAPLVTLRTVFFLEGLVLGLRFALRERLEIASRSSVASVRAAASFAARARSFASALGGQWSTPYTFP
jgi:hypothetical protein